MREKVRRVVGEEPQYRVGSHGLSTWASGKDISKDYNKE